MTHIEYRDIIDLVLPGLTYADDIVLKASSVCDMQKLLDIRTEVASRLALNFNATKSAAVLFSGLPEAPLGKLRPGVGNVAVVNSYK